MLKLKFRLENVGTLFQTEFCREAPPHSPAFLHVFAEPGRSLEGY